MGDEALPEFFDGVVDRRFVVWEEDEDEALEVALEGVVDVSFDDCGEYVDFAVGSVLEGEIDECFVLCEEVLVVVFRPFLSFHRFSSLATISSSTSVSSS